jgi:hypothetical protein
MAAKKKYTIVSARTYTGGDVQAIEKERIQLEADTDVAEYVARMYRYPVMILKGWPEEIDSYV